MVKKTMYPSTNNSPKTTLAVSIDTTATSIVLADATALPNAPNIATIGDDESAELVLYTGKSGNTITGCTRGFNGTAISSWPENTAVYRAFTSYDHDAFVENILGLDSEKIGSTELNDAVNNALSDAKESGEFEGPPGKDGSNGISPTVSVTDIEGGHRVSITDANGTKTFDVMDGVDGQDGRDGNDGHSPTITAETIAGGHRVTIVDVNGSKSFDVMNGADGQDGMQGPAGADGYDGNDGHTPVLGVDYWTEADKNQIVSDVLAAMTNAQGVSF